MIFFPYLCIMKKYGLIGRKLSHSWSARWFADMFEREGIADAEYRLYEMEDVDGVRQWAQQCGINGFNVTIPFKEQIIDRLDSLDPEAGAIQAVNCVECNNGQLVGHNTDTHAFARTLVPLLQPWHTRALVLGSGGAAKAVVYALQRLGLEALVVSRQAGRQPFAVSYDRARELAASYLIIVNCTPVGMAPLQQQSAWPWLRQLTSRHLCYDLVYNPSPTAFLSEAARAGATTCDGRAMLYTQAELSWRIWEKNQ